MMCVRKSVGLGLFTLSLMAGRSEAVGITTCDEIISGISTGTSEFELESDITCTGEITIAEDKDIAISTNGSYTLSFTAGITTTEDAVIYNKGILTLTGLTITPEEDEIPVRGISNEGELIVTRCTFNKLNVGEDSLASGGAIHSSSSDEVTIENSEFISNVAKTKGGAIYAEGTGTVSISSSTFNDNEAGIGDVTGSGGDIYADNGVILFVDDSTFTSSSAQYGGAAIESCGATITSCSFVGAEVGSETAEHYGGALLIGRPDSGGCENDLTLTNSSFSSCVVQASIGVGGSIAIFDTNAEINDCFFEKSQGTAVFFQSAIGNAITVEDSEFFENSDPSVKFANDDIAQATAFVVKNTAVVEDSGTLNTTGIFNTIFCYYNDPYECEFVYDGETKLQFNGDFKCQICSLDGERNYVGFEEDISDSPDTDSETESESSSSSDSNTGIVIGLSLALGVTLVVIGALAVWKVRVRSNARRLMEDMRENDL